MGSVPSKALRSAEDAGFDLGDATHVVLAAVPGAVVYGLVNGVLEQYVYRPMGFALSGLQDIPGAAPAISTKFPAWLSSFVAHVGMQGMWWKFVRDNKALGWVLDHRNWPQALMPRLEDTEEQRAVSPYYLMYFSYVLHSCYKDMLKSSGRKGGQFQVLFDLHHVIAVLLTAMSVHYGGWRAGVLTRLIHDIGDIVLYASKLRQAVHETRGQHPSRMVPWFAANLIVWPLTRVALYGYFCLGLNKLLRNIDRETKKGEPRWPYKTMLYSSWLMWFLQVLFTKGLIDSAVQFKRTGGVIQDPFHGTTEPMTGPA